MMTYPIVDREETSGGHPTALVDYPPAAQDGQDTPLCAHYWIIEPANGPMSRGKCRVCLEVRDFKNFVEEFGPSFN